MGETAVVAGGTGLVGRELLKLLLAEGSYANVVAIGRRPTGLSDPRLEERTMESGQPEQCLEGIPAGYDLFIATGTTIKKAGTQEAFRRVDYELPLRLAEAAASQAAGALVIVSSIGASPGSRYFYLRVKGELERQLEKLSLRRLILLRPSQLLGERQERRPGEKWAAALALPLSVLMVGKLARYRPVHAATVASAMLEAAKSAPAGVTVLESQQIAAIGSTRKGD
ncbi:MULTISPECIES: NAD-dependent epimerase/dehydratase family protein [unclassified Paenibacillus]|uniref:NAD-dependent epimerase/dehydratase family protein n=1 Tax=unclassified Paenibacillus TaxID=185978 RepID=UPI000955C687|nr:MULTISPECIES: NAD-dependent epimerase/dehydratase family protein [unclassified Paenibacillus]ASS65529.2 NAD-dependent epimerase/dehydratase family protein [Paenibacillus sp. RUD330]SIQ33073.1 Uncharacterized conserved protein YbjT, contains NAD(P)-binding and DUF2867 domains [Paenibacillus sp. RU4X]SIQ54695.1 Uncharacterized conserved protein YbjT, contains NAD(P)-binding and DUF2867 domains [Paenibacillus sp. RU4T]